MPLAVEWEVKKSRYCAFFSEARELVGHGDSPGAAIQDLHDKRDTPRVLGWVRNSLTRLWRTVVPSA
jgi:hypothetical protein